MNKQLAIIGCIVLFFIVFSRSQDIVINEIMSSNQTTIYDEDGDTSDWIELFNTGSEKINLSGFSLSDDTLDIQKWQFKDTTIDSGEHLIVFASDKDRSIILNHWETIISEADNWKYKIGISNNNQKLKVAIIII